MAKTLKMKMGQSPKTEIYKGSLSISSADIPEAKSWNIGDKIKVLVEIEVTGMERPDKWEIEDTGIKKDDIKIRSEIQTIKGYKDKS